jgi:hypothetical protein
MMRAPEVFPMKHVVLLTNAHEAPATALADVLHVAGVAALIEGIREEEQLPLTPVAVKENGESESAAEEVAPPLAVLYEVVPGADMRELYSVIEHAVAVWPSAPLVACRRPNQGNASSTLRTPDATTLKRLGFRAIADEPAQLPALLRELEDRGVTGELHLPDVVENVWLSSAPAAGEYSGAGPQSSFRAGRIASLHKRSGGRGQYCAGRTGAAGRG